MTLKVIWPLDNRHSARGPVWHCKREMGCASGKAQCHNKSHIGSTGTEVSTRKYHTYHIMTKHSAGGSSSLTSSSYTGNGIQPVED